MALLTTGTVVNQAGVTMLDFTISNDDLTATATVDIQLFSVALSTTGVTKTGAAQQLFTIPPLTVVTKTFNITGFPAYELQFNVTGDSNVAGNVFALDSIGNLVAAERVLNAEAVPPACGMPSCQWIEDPNNPIFNPPTPAYYQTVRYDVLQFTPFGPAAFYKMWYDNFSDFQNGGGISLATSPDGINWTTIANMVGLSKNTFGGGPLIDSSRHSRVLFDRSGFGTGAPYRIWYWDSAFLSVDPMTPNTLPMLRTANSIDGINWLSDTALQQDPTSPLLPLTVGSTNYTQCYGPADILFFPENPPVLDTTTPFNNRYVMYYNISDGNIEELALAVSADGVFWRREGPIPVLSRGGPGTWDENHATEGAVVLRLSPNNFKMWYSGGVNTSHEGIGCASSTDGLNWVKFPGNPIFSVFSGPSWRTGGTPPNVARTHNPWVLFNFSRFNGHGDRVCSKMWFTGGPPVNNTTGEGDDPQIGYALNQND